MTQQLHFHFFCIGEGNGNPLQYSCLENPKDRGAWWAAVYGSHRVGHDWSDLAAVAAAGLAVHHQLPEFTQTHVHRVRDAIQPSHPFSSFPQSLPSSIRVFSNESTLRMRWPKYWSFSFSIIPSKEHPGLISFRMDWLDLLAVQGTLKSLLQHHSSKLLQVPQLSPTITWGIWIRGPQHES